MRSAYRPGCPAALVTILAAVAALLAPAAASAQTTEPVLVLHDSGGPYGGLGAEYALMVRNLLGHFPVAVQTKAVSAYEAGDLGRFSATFYVGSTYDEPSWLDADGRAAYAAFLADAADPARPLVWLGQNLWRLAWDWDPAWGDGGFAQRFGFEFLGLDGGYGPGSGRFNRVDYKGVELFKGVVAWVNPGADLTGCAPEPDGRRFCAPSLGLVRVTDADKAVAVASARSTITGAQAPYVTRSSDLWYVGDIPLTYLSEEDRYLAFADLLHDMVGIDHAEQHLALARLEDVSAADRVADLDAAAGVMRARGAPFGLAVIPIYSDPLGVYNRGRPQTVRLKGSKVARALRRYVRDYDASIVQHGTTHQADFGANPYNGVSGEDFELYRVVENADHSLAFVSPVPGDSASWATGRVQTGMRELAESDLDAFAFEAPHYLASDTDYRAIAALYPVTWARVVYYPSESRSIGQFYPYPVVDAYGQKVLPESLGNIEPDDFFGYARSYPADLIRRASKLKVVRDGYASFFYHPALGPGLLDEVVDGLQRLGYRFAKPCAVVGRCKG